MKVVIADDEKYVRLVLKDTLQHLEIPIEIVGEAQDGDEAYRLCCEKEAELLITDIRMPAKDGLSLLEMIHEKLPNLSVIIYSGYDNFSYAQTAIHYGVEEYLLKPIDEVQLEAAIRKIMKKQLQETSPQVFSKEMVMNFWMEGTDEIQFFSADDTEALRQEYQKGKRESDWYNQKFLSLFLSSVKLWKTEYLWEVFEKYWEELLEKFGGSHPVLVKEMVKNFIGMEMLNLELSFKACESISSYRKQFSDAGTVQQLKDIMKECQELILEFYKEENKKNLTECTKELVEEYMLKNFSENITLEQLAEYLHFNANYTSGLFKKLFGKTFVVYLTEMRMNAAKELLQAGDFKVYEIARQIGYDDEHYFQRIFKKVIGMTPKEYQKRMKKISNDKKINIAGNDEKTNDSKAKRRKIVNIIPTPKFMMSFIEEAEKVRFAPSITKNQKYSEEIEVFTAYAEKLTGLKFEQSNQGAFCVEEDPMLDGEAYEIEITAENVQVRAANRKGLHHAFATLLLLLEESAGLVYVPMTKIEDKPQAQYRGLMVDLARSWHPFPYLKRYVDVCYFYKLSVLHLHFTDNESYTLPSEKYPKLSTKGKCYTPEEIKELTRYAYARGIELMPEIDVPGHSKCFEDAYGTLFGTNSLIHQHKDSIEAMKMLFTELCEMFPYSKYIHIGGDEAYGMIEWTSCPQCLAYGKKIGLDVEMADKERLSELFYANFISEMAQVCLDNGRQPVVWEGFDKTTNDKISREILVMSWENFYQLTPDLLEAGFKIVNCSWNPNYIVTPKTMWSKEEVYQWSIYQWKPVHPDSPYLETGYRCEPNNQVIGGQLQAWGDFIFRGECESVAAGVAEEFKNILERLPFVAENTWNVEKIQEFEVLKNAADHQNKMLEKLWGYEL